MPHEAALDPAGVASTPGSVAPEVLVGSWREVADGLFRINVPVPFRGLRQVNLWLIRDGDGGTMIDCGWGDEQTRDLIAAAWRDVLGDRPLTRLLVTHFHPDHMGNCGWIASQWKLCPELTQTEWMAANLALRNLYSDDVDTRARFFVQNGIPPDPLGDFLSSLSRIATLIPDSALVLPSHRDPFRGARRRIGELREHHAHRLDVLRAEVRRRGEASAGDCLAALFQGTLDGHQVAFAMAEALAHLNYLVLRGEAARIERTDGSVRFRLVAP